MISVVYAGVAVILNNIVFKKCGYEFFSVSVMKMDKVSTETELKSSVAKCPTYAADAIFAFKENIAILEIW